MKQYDLNGPAVMLGKLAVAFGILAGALVMFQRCRRAVNIIPDADTGLGLPSHQIEDAAGGSVANSSAAPHWPGFTPPRGRLLRRR